MKNTLSAILLALMLGGTGIANAGISTSSGLDGGDINADGISTSSGLAGEDSPTPCGISTSSGICSESSGSFLDELLDRFVR